jgi:ribosome small subunit-dependent GTPase A
VYRLTQLGWNQFFENQRAPLDRPEWIPGRVVEEGRGLYRLVAEAGEGLAEMAGKVRLSAESGARPPAVGDWVLASWPAGGRARIERVLSARTRFSRRAAGKRAEEQVLAANIDTAFLVTSCNRDFNVRRLERYLAAACDSGARPVLVLNKTDLVSEPEAWKAEAQSILAGVPVLLASAAREDGIAALKDHVPAGETAALLGSSGVGKSSLINALIGFERQRVGATRVSERSSTRRDSASCNSGRAEKVSRVPSRTSARSPRDAGFATAATTASPDALSSRRRRRAGSIETGFGAIASSSGSRSFSNRDRIEPHGPPGCRSSSGSSRSKSGSTGDERLRQAGLNRLLKNGVERRCERRGTGCQAPRRRRCHGASQRSGNAADGPRRRNRLRWLAFCSRCLHKDSRLFRRDSLASRIAKGQTRRPHPFFSSLLERVSSALTSAA